ncbi:hypothetical protein BIV25_30850 [Streptomyces sp. MUSC 14]|uniref:hypothetical protein n=1 Tax=Streptomyces sp. MUSC 14 TaxID=1354889 RepID=UPI0008F583B0|nr:hypothetical protein [Streptomyces sp. MUSC 14]OIJ90688.1 hypothetical protein BIV25_30850 [Streptomyces sp. MUSC 14]
MHAAFPDPVVHRWHIRACDSAVAYGTVAAARGRGVAVRATTALSRWAFEETGPHRLELSHATADEASCGATELNAIHRVH